MITDAINSPDRPAADKALDAGRRPDQIMAFYAIKPGMKIADIFAGGGYMTELYARIVGSTGTVYSQNGPFPKQFKKSEDTWNQRLKEPALNNVVKVSKPFDAPDLLPVPPDSLDAVIIHLNYHDMVGFKLNRENVNAAVLQGAQAGRDLRDRRSQRAAGRQRYGDHHAPSNRRGFSNQGCGEGGLQAVRSVERAAPP